MGCGAARAIPRAVTLAVSAGVAFAGASPVGPAPAGDARAVASRIIKDNFPACQRVTQADRMPDGGIRASCDGKTYRVFTINEPGRAPHKVALNCAVAKRILNLDC